MAKYFQPPQRYVTPKDVTKVHQRYQVVCDHLNDLGVSAEVKRRRRTKHMYSSTRMSISHCVSSSLNQRPIDGEEDAERILGFLKEIVGKHNLMHHEIGSNFVYLNDSTLYVWAWLLFLESKIPEKRLPHSSGLVIRSARGRRNIGHPEIIHP